MSKKKLIDSASRFARLLLEICEKYPRLRFNVAMPGYILECIDPLVISSLRDMVKRGSVEWLCMGYTEPFLSFSPLWLTGENINLGVKVFSELTGEAPMGFVPPFSNWEPSHIDMFNSAGLKYAAISSVLLTQSETESVGYWITEYTGSSIAVFPARSYHSYNAPQSVVEWIKEAYHSDKPDKAPRMIILKYLYPLEDIDVPDHGDQWGSRRNFGKKKQQNGNNHGKNSQTRNQTIDDNPQGWLERISAEIDKHILELQPLRFKDVLGDTPPLGLHYFPSSLVPSHNEPTTPYFLNRLHCYDQIGVMQRKMMDVCDSVSEVKDTKSGAALKRHLFFAQDINRFLPSERSGFNLIADRLWTYGKLIYVERELYEIKGARNGVIRLTDFMRNGYKSVIMANCALKLYIDHKNGAQVYELDYIERAFNVCAAYNPAVRARPNVILPRESRLGFRDMIFTKPLTYVGYRKGDVSDCSNFSDSAFEYLFKHSPLGVKVLFNRNGYFAYDGRHCPLSMDKVFGLEKDSAALSFSYKLGNSSLMDYAFSFGMELPLALPGCPRGSAFVCGNKKKTAITHGEPTIMENITEWWIEDEEVGVRMEFVTQKRVNIWLYTPEIPVVQENSNGMILLISCPVEIEKNSSISITGMIKFKKINVKGASGDSL